MLVCLCKTHLRVEGVTHLQKRNLKSDRLSSTSVMKEYLPMKFIKTSWKPLRSLNFIAQCKNGQHNLRMGERALRMMENHAASRMPSLMKMSRSCTPWICVMGGETCEA